jgi:hypothetical protein
MSRFKTYRFLGFDLRRARKSKGNSHYLRMTPKKDRKAIKAKMRDGIQHSGATPLPKVTKKINARLPAGSTTSELAMLAPIC